MTGFCLPKIRKNQILDQNYLETQKNVLEPKSNLQNVPFRDMILSEEKSLVDS